MKRNLTLLLALTLVIVALLTSCGECDVHTDENRDEACDVCDAYVPFVPAYLGFEGYYQSQNDTQDNSALGAAELATEFRDMSIISSSYDYVLFANASASAGELNYAVLNANTGEVVYKQTKENDGAKITSTVEVVSIGNESFIHKSTTDTTDENLTRYTLTVYNMLGTELAKKTASAPIGSSFAYHFDDLYSFDGKVYHIVDGVATYKCELGLGKLPNCDIITDEYNYKLDDTSVSVYDQAYQLVSYYEIPSNAEAISQFVLSDGNLFVQYAITLPSDAEEYDLYDADEDIKQNITSLIYNVEDQTATVIAFDYVVSFMINELSSPAIFGELFVADKLDNVARLYKIAEKTVDYNNAIYAELDQSLRVIGYLAEEIEAQDSIPFPICENRFLVYDKLEREFLLNEKGEIIGEITNAEHRGDGIFYYNGKYFDMNLNVIFNSETCNYVLMDGATEYAIYRDRSKSGENTIQTKYYLFKDGTMTKLNIDGNAYGFDCYNDYFCYTLSYKEDGVYKNYRVYCNNEGEEIYRIDTSAAVYYSHSASMYGDVLIIRYVTETDSAYKTYYYISK